MSAVVEAFPPASATFDLELSDAAGQRPATASLFLTDRARGLVELCLIAVFIVTCVIDAVGAPSALRCMSTLLAAISLPGAAALTMLPVRDWPTAGTLIVAISIAVGAITSLVLAWTGWWHPVVVAVALGATSALVLGADLRRRSAARSFASRRRVATLLRGLTPQGVAPLGIGLALWLVSLPQINAAEFGESGLVGRAPPIFFIGLAVTIAGAAYLAVRPGTNGWLIAAYVVGVVIYLYGTIPAIADSPQYAWTYKHIGVTHLIGATGTVHPGVDIYNRWPGMFTLSAAFSAIASVDAVRYAGWAELVFAALQASAVAAIALSATGRREIASVATLVWLVTNWIGQTYFSPQAMAYLLDLALLLVLVQQLPLQGTARRRLTAIVGRIVRAPQTEPVRPPATWNPRVAVAIVLLLAAAAVVSHQLTPYMVILQALVLTLLGLRPRWLALAIAAMTVIYLVPNLSYVQSHYGLFNGLNPLDNAQVQRLQAHRAWFYSHVGGLLSLITMMLAALAALRLARRGLAQPALPLAALALAPSALLFANNYGGEGSLRVFLFSSPWLAILIGWAVVTLAFRWRALVSIVGLSTLSTLFLFAFIGNAGTNVIPGDEVAASNYFYSHAPAHSVLMLAGEDFPLEVGRRYAVMAGPGGDHSPNLLESPQFRNRMLGASDVPAIIRAIQQYSPSGYLVFSTTQYRYAAYFGTTPSGTFENLEHAVAQSSRFTLWYRSRNARIYRVRGAGGCAPSTNCGR